MFSLRTADTDIFKCMEVNCNLYHALVSLDTVSDKH